jgi:hypothetical protein
MSVLKGKNLIAAKEPTWIERPWHRESFQNLIIISSISIFPLFQYSML